MSTPVSTGRRRTAPKRTPPKKSALTRERIVETALAIADREGVNGLTMRAVADDLGVAPMSLYRHVANKDDLLQEICDAAMADYPSMPPGLSWDEGLRLLFRELRAALLRHPSLGQVYADRPLSGANIYRFVDTVFSVLLEAGFEPEAAVNAFHALSTSTVGATLFEISRAAGAAPPSADRLRIERLERAAADGLPAFAAVAPFMRIRGTQAQFEYGLGHLIDGLRADLDANRRPAKPRRAAPRPSRADR